MSITEAILETIFKGMAKVFGSANDRELKKLWPVVEKVNAAWEPIRSLSDDQLRAKTDEFRCRLLGGESEDDILPEAFAVCREASHRTLGEKKMVFDKWLQKEIPLFAHFDVQIIGGTVLHNGSIAEMVTGEGKTLVATLPSYLNALRPCEMWVEKAKELQGEDMTKWVFKPYGLLRDENGNDVWTLMDRLFPSEEEAVIWKRPELIVPLSRGIHVVTTNDVLAARDANYTRPLYDFLGLTVGAIQANMGNAERVPVYMSDITYGTNNEFGFDYLRDNLKVRAEDQVQRSRFYAVVDEVDQVLIDEARTPLIISGSTNESTDKYYIADRAVRKLQGGDMLVLEEKLAQFMKQGLQREDARLKVEEDFDFVFSERDHTAKLTERGMNHILRVLDMDDIYSGANMDMPHFIDNALKAHSIYKLDHHYIVRDGQVYIVDEFTGRVLEGRRWSDGLHQAVEAKEGMKIKEESQTVATITFQNFYRLYHRLGGMTGTASTEQKEFRDIYNLGVVTIPTNRPLIRFAYPDLIYGTEKEKYQQIAEHVLEIYRTGRPVLIGTVSIERSEVISAYLKHAGVKHEVLNGRQHAREAEIVALAGQFGAITVSTNMAGRGTDIRLGTIERAALLEHWQRWGLAPKKGVSPEMSDEQLMPALREVWVEHYLSDIEDEFSTKMAEEWDSLLAQRWKEMGINGPALTEKISEMGGLFILGTERHEARRIDNQLRGRAGRQGDPGSSRFYLSLEDDLMRLFASDRVAGIMRSLGLKEGVPIESRMVTRTVERSQRKVEERNFEVRRNLLEYDSVMNEQRKIVYERRQTWLEGRELKESMLEYCEAYIRASVPQWTGNSPEDWDVSAICGFMGDTFYVGVTSSDLDKCKNVPEANERLLDFLADRLIEAYDKKENRIGEDNMRLLEKLILLETIDRKWMDHLHAMEVLKEGIHLWGYAGQDPKIRYKKDGYEMFQELWDGFEGDVAQLVMKVTPVQQMEVEEAVEVETAVHDDFDSYANKQDAVAQNAGEKHHEPIRNTTAKAKPNDTCPCGSGKKYKKCCGRGQ